MTNVGLSKEMSEALRRYGVNDMMRSSLTMRSDLIRDLKIVGDDFGEFWTVLVSVYGAAPLFAEQQIPSELSSDSFWITMSRWVPGACRFVRTPPLPLQQIEDLFVAATRA
jgi:hypothetical protein